MALEKLKIKTKGRDQAKGGITVVEAHFNPNRIVLGKSVKLVKEPAKGRDVPEQQFAHGEPRTLNLDLLFDTYDTDSQQKENVTVYTGKLDSLIVVSPKPHRPPICWLQWGAWVFFDSCVLEKLDHEYTLFLDDGTPVRATSKCTFKESSENPNDLARQNRESSDVAKHWVVKRGDTVSSIAAEEYDDPALWRHIADYNDLDDPFDLEPGTTLLLPAVTIYRSGRSRP